LTAVRTRVILASVRVAIVTTILIALAVGAWAANAAAPLPPQCSAADIQSRATLQTPGYVRYCGPAQAVLWVGGKRFAFKVGRCSPTRMYFGFLSNRGTSPSRGVILILGRRMSPGRNHIMDWAAALPGVNLDRIPGIGTAIVSKSLERATFSLDVEGSTNKVRGSWSCG
jgi:hypothetical protein